MKKEGNKDMVFNIKDKKVIGFSLLTVFVFEFVSMLLSLSLTEYKDYLYAFSFISIFLLAISFFVKDKKTHKIVLAISFFVASLFEIIYIIQQSFSISAFLCLLLYGTVGVMIWLDKPKKKTLIILIMVLIFVTLCYSAVSSRLLSYLLKYSSAYKSFMYLGNYSIIGAVELIAVLLDVLSGISAECEHKRELTINTDVISFKDLLQFVESEYNSGRITEEEYQAKRKEILSKL